MILALVGFLFIRNKSFLTIDLADYYNVTFSGADGLASLDYEFDDARFINENKDKIKLSYPSKDSYSQNPIEIASDLAQSIDFNTDTYEIENNYKVKIKNANKIVKVAGLSKVSKLNPAEYYEVEVDGISPNAYLDIVKKDNAPQYLDYVKASIDKTSNI